MKHTSCRNKLLPRLLTTHTNISYEQQCEHKHFLSQVYVSDQSDAILDFINLFMATCFGFNYKPPWGIL